MKTKMETKDTCEWWDEDGMWVSSCGGAFQFNEDGPKENEFHFCYRCGKPPITEVTQQSSPCAKPCFEIPLTGRDLLIALRDGKTVQIGRTFLVRNLRLIEECSDSVIDVRTEGDKAFLTPERFRMTEIGEQAIKK